MTDQLARLRDRLDAAEKLSEERRVLLARTLAREVEVEKRAERAEAERDALRRIIEWALGEGDDFPD